MGSRPGAAQPHVNFPGSTFDGERATAPFYRCSATVWRSCVKRERFRAGHFYGLLDDGLKMPVSEIAAAYGVGKSIRFSGHGSVAPVQN